MYSAIYSGTVFHKRYIPRTHAFKYRLFMMFLDLDELAQVTKISWLCSQKWWSPLRFKREDFHGDPQQPVKSEIYKTVKSQLGIDLNGPVRVLNQWRCFGFNFNPLSTYYCYCENGEVLRAIVAEVTNTPWFERRAYAFEVNSDDQSIQFDKDFTVSPFNPINLTYRWCSTQPGSHLSIRIDTYHHKTHNFHASMGLNRQSFSHRSILNVVTRFPLTTYKVVAAIYWEALRLFIKGVPFLGKDKTLV